MKVLGQYTIRDNLPGQNVPYSEKIDEMSPKPSRTYHQNNQTKWKA